MKTIRIKLPSINDVEFTLTCEPEDMDFVGNCSAVDPKTDKKNEDWIRQQLEDGNEWAWCCVKMTAKYKSFEGVDYLGGCSYKSEEDFKKDGYYKDMKQQAYSDLMNQLNTLKD